jgi:hypothetical protein
VISRLRALWNNVFRRKQLDRDLDEELQAYLELVSAEKMREGVSPEEAYRDARRDTGGVDQVLQSVRDVRVGVWLDRLVQDVQYGVRTLAKNPTFSLVAVGTLALGIGANTAMFSLLDQVVLRLLPVRHPEQLVIVRETGNHYGTSYGANTISWPMFEDLRDNNHVFSGMFCRFPATVTIGYGDRAAQIPAELVSGSFGQRFGLVNDMEPVSPDNEVIGVIPDRKYRDLRETPPARAYFPYFEGAHFRFMNVYLRTQDDPRQIENELRERMRQFDPHVLVVGLQTMNEQIGFSLRTERLVASLSAVFGGLATLLAVIGLYGVMAYVVMRRTREIGIRIALGALRSNVIAMVMREVFILIGAGLAAGFSLALALANLIRSQLYGLNARDPLTFIGSAVVLALAAGSAGFIPALRASSVDPATAPRHE